MIARLLLRWGADPRSYLDAGRCRRAESRWIRGLCRKLPERGRAVRLDPGGGAPGAGAGALRPFPPLWIRFTGARGGARRYWCRRTGHNETRDRAAVAASSRRVTTRLPDLR